MAQEKVISEAVVAIPYFERAILQNQLNAAGEVEEVMLTTPMYGKNFFKIPIWNFAQQKKNIETELVAVPAEQNRLATSEGLALTEIVSTTITDTIQAMKKYVIPPNMDFVKYYDPNVTEQSINPFVMYIFEFEQTLAQKDLSDIWQGVMPDSALKMSDGEITISHDLSPFEFFGNVLNQEILGEMKFFVFKIKKKAKYNYYELTKDSTDDSRFNYTFQGDPVSSAIALGGSYNWPYDFFSLVEAAKIEAKFTLKNKADG